MITMVMIGKVLRMHRRDKKSVREIVKATSLSRNTVRKYLRLGKAEQPRYRRPAVPTKLAPYVEQLEQALRQIDMFCEPGRSRILAGVEINFGVSGLEGACT